MSAVDTEIRENPEMHGAAPVHGNFTADAETHLWCAAALSTLVASPQTSLEEFNDDIQAAVRYLLQCEVQRAQQASRAGR